MRQYLTILTLLFAAGFASTSAAQSEIPDLQGTWTCDPVNALIDGKWTTGLHRKIEVVEQRDETFRATNAWAADPSQGVQGDRGGTLSYSETVPFFGVISFDNKTIVGVSKDDGYRMIGELTDNDTWRFVLSETGAHPFVLRSVCRRDH